MIQWIRICYLTRSWGEKHCLSPHYNFILKLVFLGILEFTDEQRLGRKPPQHGTDFLVPNPPVAPVVYRRNLKLFRLEFKTCSTRLQWTDSSQHKSWLFLLFSFHLLCPLIWNVGSFPLLLSISLSFLPFIKFLSIRNFWNCYELMTMIHSLLLEQKCLLLLFCPCLTTVMIIQRQTCIFKFKVFLG